MVRKKHGALLFFKWMVNKQMGDKNNNFFTNRSSMEVREQELQCSS
jgi:hypothetical protein